MVRKVYTARNGAKYIKLANGQCRFVSGASRQYLNKIRKMRGGKRCRSVDDCPRCNECTGGFCRSYCNRDEYCDKYGSCVPKGGAPRRGILEKW